MKTNLETTGYDEMTDVGKLYFSGCGPLDLENVRRGILVGVGYNANLKTILLDCLCPDRSVRYSLTVNQARALSNLLAEAIDD